MHLNYCALPCRDPNQEGDDERHNADAQSARVPKSSHTSPSCHCHDFDRHRTCLLNIYPRSMHTTPFSFSSKQKTDCAVCSDGCGAGVDNSCHSCSGTQAYLLTAAGTIFSLVVVAFLALAVIFLIGGLDAVGAVKRSISATVSGRRSAPSALVWSRPGINVLPGDSIISRSQYSKNSTTAVDPVGGSGDEAFAPAFEPVASRDAVVEGIATGIAHRTNDIGDSHQVPEVGGGNTGGNNAWAVSEIGTGRKLNVALLAMPPVTRGGVPERALGSGDINLNDSGDYGGDQPQKSGCCGLGTKIKLCMSRIPMDKLKILVVVWQILTVFPSIAAVEFPPIYARFLTWIDVVNLDLGNILSASCLLPSVTHYERLLAITLGPFVVLLVLSVTFQMAKRRAGIGSAGVVARRAAWSRHMAAGLLLTFLVRSSLSCDLLFLRFPMYCAHAQFCFKIFLLVFSWK